MFPLKQFDIHAEIAGGGADVGVAKHDLHGAQIAAVVDERGGKAGTEQVRVVPGPWFVPGCEADAIAPAGKADGVSGVAVDDLPHAARAAEGFAVVCHKQDGGLAGACRPALVLPIVQQAHHLVRELHKAAGDVQQTMFNHGVADRKPDEIAGADAGFIQQPHDDVVAEPHQRSEVRRGQDGADLVVAQVSRQPLWRSRGTRQHGGRVMGRVGISLRPPVKTAYRAQFEIKCRWPNGTAAGTYPRIYGGF